MSAILCEVVERPRVEIHLVNLEEFEDSLTETVKPYPLSLNIDQMED